MDERTAKFQELMETEGAVEELLSCKTPEEAQSYLEGKGIQFTIEEIKEIGAVLAKIAKGEISSDQFEGMMNGELSEDELEAVAGGIFVVGTAAVVGTVITAIGTGALVGAGTYYTVKYWDKVTDGLSTAWDVLTSW